MPAIPQDDEFERLLEEYSRIIFARIRAFDHEKHGIDRDDLLQEVRVRIWQMCREGKASRGSIPNLRAYIRKLVFTTVLKEIAKERTRRKTLERSAAATHLFPPEAAPPGSDDGAAFRRAMRSALVKLPRREEAVIRLRLRGFGFDEIARLRGISGYQVRHYYYRGIEKLKAKLGIKGEIR